MRVNLKLSRVGMSMQEATIAKWHKAPGDSFAAGDVLYEIETEKVTQEITAPGAGKLLEVLVPEGHRGDERRQARAARVHHHPGQGVLDLGVRLPADPTEKELTRLH